MIFGNLTYQILIDTLFFFNFTCQIGALYDCVSWKRGTINFKNEKIK